MKLSSILLCVLLIMSCKSNDIVQNQPIPPVESIYLDEKFEGYDDFLVETEEEVFAIDDEMRLMVKTELAPIKDPKKRAEKLLQQLFDSDTINIQYVGLANLTARQTYHQGSANCMSLTIMAYSLAKEADLTVNFQDVYVPEYWQRNGDYNMMTGHVNLLIKTTIDAPNVIKLRDKVVEIDFDPFVAKKSFKKKLISKHTMLAIFYNNKGANALANRDFNTAYRYFKAAVKADKKFSSAWGNLGILYKTTGNYEHADFAYRKAIFLDDYNNTALDNYAILLRKNGFHDDAEVIEKKILQRRVSNPYYYALLASEAEYKGNYDIAVNHYRKAIKLNNRIDELYIGLASTYYKMGNYKSAQAATKKAIQINKNADKDQQYLAKLNFLKQADHTH